MIVKSFFGLVVFVFKYIAMFFSFAFTKLVWLISETILIYKEYFRIEKQSRSYKKRVKSSRNSELL